MADPRTVTVYIDCKSPYAYLAKDLAYELERDFPVRVDWLPCLLDIPSFLGSARVDDSGRCRGRTQCASMAAGTVQPYGLPPRGAARGP